MLCTARHVRTRARPEVTLWRTRPRDRTTCPEMDLLGRTWSWDVTALSWWLGGYSSKRLPVKLCKIFHNCLPIQTLLLLVPIPQSVYGGWQKPIFSCTDPPWRGATCLNKTNKSGGPKDEADACPPPPAQTKMLSLTEWREWMGTMSDQPGTRGLWHQHIVTCHRSGHSHTINQTKLIRIFKANPRSKAGTWVTAWLNPK